jgi:hypothetical protein
MAKVIKYLTSKCRAQSSIPSADATSITTTTTTTTTTNNN